MAASKRSVETGFRRVCEGEQVRRALQSCQDNGAAGSGGFFYLRLAQPFSAFLVESHPEAPTLLKIILHAKRDDCADPGESVAHQPEQRMAAQAYHFAGID
jgi:hypothetical protein